MELFPFLAYLDPGTGSMILQVIIGCIVGAAYAIKSYWYKILSWFGIHEKEDKETSVIKQKDSSDK